MLSANALNVVVQTIYRILCEANYIYSSTCKGLTSWYTITIDLSFRSIQPTMLIA